MIPTFKGYGGFPGNVCVSVNEEVVHGIPDKKRILKEGDIVSVDVGAIYKGYTSDAARTYPVGEISEEAARLIRVTRESFFAGIEFARPGCRLSDISHAVPPPSQAAPQPHWASLCSVHSPQRGPPLPSRSSQCGGQTHRSIRSTQ